MKIALICSDGGHLTQMHLILESFQGHNVFFVTYNNVRTRKLTHQKYLINVIGTNPIKMSIAFLTFFKIFLKERPDIVVTTGAELAIPAFYIAKLLGAKTIFIESWSRVKTNSGTGRIVYPVADIFLVQWPHLLKIYGKKAQYQGSVI
jgi:UDP-N-acetylglucosamine:LPS N-acetylglucosamine transferase